MAGRKPGRSHAELVAKLWGSPVPPGLKHGGRYVAGVYGCDCELCLPSGKRRKVRPEGAALTGTERRRRSRANLHGKPVPPGTKHGTYTYHVYGCRCDVCLKAKVLRREREINAWRATARGGWLDLGERTVVHWPPADAAPDWTCPDCGWRRDRDVDPTLLPVR